MPFEQVLAYLPSPSTGVLHLGPVPVRAYALCIIAGVVLAVVMGNRRFVARGGQDGAVADVATIAVPAGLVGARIYHVVTSPGAVPRRPGAGAVRLAGRARHPGRHPRRGAGRLAGVPAARHPAGCVRRRDRARAWRSRRPSAGSATGSTRSSSGGRRRCRGAWRSTRSTGRRGTPTSRPSTRRSCTSRCGTSASRCVVLWADRRFRLSGGRAFALYLALYAAGRAWIEALRVDEATSVPRPAAQRLGHGGRARRQRHLPRRAAPSPPRDGGPGGTRRGRADVASSP